MAMSYEEWVEKYKPLCDDDSPDSIIVFDTHGEDVKFLNEQNPRCIWTEISDWFKDGEDAIVSGSHLVNRICYYVTEIEWEEEYIDVIIDNDW